MKIIHTSDWHLGRSLYNRKRYEESADFLNWLADLIDSENIDALLIAGDVFDNSTPSNRAQELYYSFLSRIAVSCCKNIIIIAGNHDSPSLLNASKDLLKVMNIFVIGSVEENIENEVIVLKDKIDLPAAIVCAVPYLRDKDIRTSEIGEDIGQKNIKLIEGIKNHYHKVLEIARQKSSASLPIIAMGHLFTTGGKTIKDDGVRELYVGSLAHVNSSIFPDYIDYLALGHLHIPQKIATRDNMRYSGSPLPMGFGEAKDIKKLISIEFRGNNPIVQEIEIPSFQRLERISGDLNVIQKCIEDFKSINNNIWLEIEYTGEEIIPNLKTVIDELVNDSDIEVLRINNKRILRRYIERITEDETLDDLNENQVFARCLDVHEITADERLALNQCYQEILFDLQDKNSDQCTH